MYSKTSLFFNNEEVASKKRKCLNTKEMLDFSKEHKFKLDGELLDDFNIKVEIKRGTSILYKSKIEVSKWKDISKSYSSTDSVLADLILGPDENGLRGYHWRKMMDQPGGRIFVWHQLNYKD